MVEKYKNKNGQIEIANIVTDVMTNQLSEDEIRALCQDEEIRATFIGKGYPESERRPKEEWDEDYLNLTYFAVIGEAFNLEYLLHLHEVAEFVAQKKQKAKRKKQLLGLGVAAALLIVIGLVIYVFSHRR